MSNILSLNKRSLAILLGAIIVSLSLHATPTVHAATGSDPSIGPTTPFYFTSENGYPTWTTVNGHTALQLTPVVGGQWAGAAWHALNYTGQTASASLNGTYTQTNGLPADGFTLMLFAQNGTGSLSYMNNSIPGTRPVSPNHAECGYPGVTSSTGVQGTIAFPNSTTPFLALQWDPFYGPGPQFNLWIFNPYCRVVANPGAIGCSIGVPAALDTIKYEMNYTSSSDTLGARVADNTSGINCSFSLPLLPLGFNPPSPGKYWVFVEGNTGGLAADWTIYQVVIVPTLRSTSTSVKCSGNALGSQCTATVTDTSSGTPQTPTGIVTWTSSSSTGVFKPSSCSLAGSGSTASCTVGYSPSGNQNPLTITATYHGDNNHFGSSGSTILSTPN